MENLIDAIIELVSNSPPDKTEQLVELIRQLSSIHEVISIESWAANPRAANALATLISAWQRVEIPPTELAAMLTAATAAYHRAKTEQDIELVWTGPSSKLVATRKTEQALLHVIDAAQARLFVTSFVAYDVPSIMAALRKAIDRGVEVSMLLESSDRHGGGVSMDVIGKMREALPAARIYFWGEKGESYAGGKVHAKVAVCDEVICFISSANLTGHAMEKNMEVGVLIRGGSVPTKLQNHLEALATIKILNT